MRAPAPSDVVESVRRSCRTAHGQDPLDEATSLRLKHRGLDGAQAWVSGTEGFALLYEGRVDLAVAPESRGRGIGRELAALALADHAAVTAWSHGDHPAAARLADVHGLERGRELWVMRRPASIPLPDLVVLDSVMLRGFEAGDEAEVLRVNAAAFAAHPEQGAMDAADVAVRMAEPWFDPAGLIVAVADETVLGFHWTKRHSPALGEVYVVGIDPDAQGRGLGKQLTLAGLRHLHDKGVSEVVLYVESDNRAGVSLYSRLGFTHAAQDTHVQYRR